MASFLSSNTQLISDIPRTISTKRSMPLCFDGIYGFPNVVLDDIRKHLSKFSGNHTALASQHVQVFSDLMGDYEIAREDVYMKLFVQTLECDARDWFSFLPACSISSWSELHVAFMEKFGERVSLFDSYSKFLRIHIEDGELVPQFNIIFVRTLNEIPEKCRPEDQVCLIVYLGAFYKKMSYQLRDKEPQTLYQAFYDCYGH